MKNARINGFSSGFEGAESTSYEDLVCKANDCNAGVLLFMSSEFDSVKNQICGPHEGYVKC